MITHERIEERIGIEERRSYYKALLLISPEKAQELGMRAEAPILVSPLIFQEKICQIPNCGVRFTPLVYQVGYQVRAQHFHEDDGGGGGIYYYAVTGPEAIIHNKDSVDYWFAMVEPSLNSRGEFILRAEQVLVERILAYCSVCHRNVGEGLLSELLYTGQLYPICNDHENEDKKKNSPSHPRYPKFKFEITRDGRVVFGNLRA